MALWALLLFAGLVIGPVITGYITSSVVIWLTNKPDIFLYILAVTLVLAHAGAWFALMPEPVSAVMTAIIAAISFSYFITVRLQNKDAVQ